MDDTTDQIRHGLNYIRDRYSNGTQLEYGWYDRGANLPGTAEDES